MCERATVRAVTFSPADADARVTGLLGWVKCRVADLLIDGITVRRTRDGRLVLAFPARRGRDGQRYAYVRPIDDDARRSIERQILGAIGLEHGGGS